MKSFTSLLVCSMSLVFFFTSCNSDTNGPSEEKIITVENRNPGGIGIPRGLLKNKEDLLPGYIIINPTNSSSSYLMNREGIIVHEWKGYYHSWLTYLMDDGRVVRNSVDPDAPRFYAGGMAGRIEELSWEGETLWDFEYANEDHQNHHDIAVMPNGNVLAVSWDYVSPEEAIEAGRNPEYLPKDGIWLDKIIEVEPMKPRGGKIVWEWKFKDHLIQDFDPTKANFGDPASHPELWDINASAEIPEPMDPDTLFRKRKEGKINKNATTGSDGADVLHCNAINYNADLQQIVFSSPHISEIFIIDHSTSRKEASGHTGGKYGKGGDFLYRWGNPQNYSLGDSTDQMLFGQHDVRWIEKGLPGEGHLTLFNNHIPGGRDSMEYSAIFEIVTPLESNGTYARLDDGTYGPETPFWSYIAEDSLSFFSPFTSGAQRMENGNTFILCGISGRTFEVTSDGEIVWEYWNPYIGDIRETNGDPINDGPFKYWEFRSTFIPADHPALDGKELLPLDPQPEIYEELKK